MEENWDPKAARLTLKIRPSPLLFRRKIPKHVYAPIIEVENSYHGDSLLCVEMIETIFMTNHYKVGEIILSIVSHFKDLN